MSWPLLFSFQRLINNLGPAERELSNAHRRSPAQIDSEGDRSGDLAESASSLWLDPRKSLDSVQSCDNFDGLHWQPCKTIHVLLLEKRLTIARQKICESRRKSNSLSSLRSIALGGGENPYGHYILGKQRENPSRFLDFAGRPGVGSSQPDEDRRGWAAAGSRRGARWWFRRLKRAWLIG